mgnify:CR=1 FL=1
MNPILIIDSGHGGEDPGGGSNQYWKEKDLALKISLYQYKRFKDLGINVALTRDKDIALKPSERTNIVKRSNAKYCISNHINAGGGEGAETIYSIYSNPTLANIILNALVGVGQIKRRAFTRTLPRDLQKDYYFMHRDTGKTETVIVEYGFADNTNDTKRLLENWKQYAESVVKAFCLHIGYIYTPVQKNEHWAELYYNSLIKKGIKINEKRFDDTITRGEMFVLLDRITDQRK